MFRCSAFFSSSPFVTCFIVQHFPIFNQKAAPCEVSVTLAPATTQVWLPLATEALTHPSFKIPLLLHSVLSLTALPTHLRGFLKESKAICPTLHSSGNAEPLD